MLKQKSARIGLVVALTIGLLGGGVAGLIMGGSSPAGAQDAPTTTAPADQGEAARAKAREKATEWLAETLQPLVDNGTINSAQAEAVTKAIIDAEPGKALRPAFRKGYRTGIRFDIVANALGVSVADLRADLSAGKSISDVAKEQNVDVQKVIDALVANTKANLDTAVANGKLTQAEADERLKQATELFTKLVDRKRPAGATQNGG